VLDDREGLLNFFESNQVSSAVLLLRNHKDPKSAASASSNAKLEIFNTVAKLARRAGSFAVVRCENGDHCNTLSESFEEGLIIVRAVPVAGVPLNEMVYDNDQYKGSLSGEKLSSYSVISILNPKPHPLSLTPALTLRLIV